MKKATLLTILSAGIAIVGYSQNPWELGAEYMRSIGKGFNGNMAGPRYETFSNKNSFNVGFTYHFSSKNSYSFSKGFGMYAGYRYSFGSNTKGNNPFAGLRVLFSFENFEGKTNLNSLMMTPMAEAGYHFVFAKRIFTSPFIAGGYTVKITKENNSLDEDVGGRFIPGIAAGYRF